jgi:hypothetical protein
MNTYVPWFMSRRGVDEDLVVFKYFFELTFRFLLLYLLLRMGSLQGGRDIGGVLMLIEFEMDDSNDN